MDLTEIFQSAPLLNGPKSQKKKEVISLAWVFYEQSLSAPDLPCWGKRSGFLFAYNTLKPRQIKTDVYVKKKGTGLSPQHA